jgi:hypothetical protein
MALETTTTFESSSSASTRRPLTMAMDPSDWSLWWWVIMGAALFALTDKWSAMRPLREFFLIMTMIYVLTIVLSMLQQTSIWTSWFDVVLYILLALNSV